MDPSRVGRLRPSHRTRNAIGKAPNQVNRPHLHRSGPRGPRPQPVVLWIHGGGYVIGSAQQDDHLCAQLVQRLGQLALWLAEAQKLGSVAPLQKAFGADFPAP